MKPQLQPQPEVNGKAVAMDKASEQDEDNPKDIYTLLITEAPYLRGDLSPLVPSEEIPWLDKTLIEQSLGFHRKYLTLVILADTFALMFGFCVKPNSAVVMRTGKLHQPELSFQRYLSTIQRIAKFFMLPFDQVKAYKAFDTVRKMHALASQKKLEDHPSKEQLKLDEPWKAEVAKAMRQDLEHIKTDEAPCHLLTWDPEVPVSQFDMVLTQFGFIGTMWLFPRVFGIKDREEELKGLIHAWAVFGRLLGIKDEYNICIKPDAQLYDKIFKNVIVESLKTMDPTVVTIQSAFVDALSQRLPFITYKSMLYFGLQEIEGYQGEHLWALMSFRDKVSLKILQSWFWGMRNVTPYRICMHVVTGLWLQFQFWWHLPTSFWD